MASTRSATLRKQTHAFCQALINFPGIHSILGEYFARTPSITEHGPEWARSRLPFIGKTYTGAAECEEYFTLMGSTLILSLNAESMPGPEGFIVDAETGMVSVVCRAHCESRKTGKGYDESVIYRFSDFDDEGRFGHWEIWADTLSAWDAVGE